MPGARLGGSQDSVRGSASNSGPRSWPQSNRSSARHCACATPRSAPDREGEGRGDEGAGRRPPATPERLGAGSRETTGLQACAQRVFLPGPKLRDSARWERCEPCARASDRILSPRALLGRAFSGVLATPAAAVRAVAWLLLWEAAGFTCSPATTFNNTHVVAGKGRSWALGVGRG